MIRVRTQTIEKGPGHEDIVRRVKDTDATVVDTGVHADEGAELVIIASANEFGADINHPGGTKYGYRTPQDAQRGRVTFLPGGQGYKVLGETPPHRIKIPSRSYIRSTVDENQEQWGDLATEYWGQIVDQDLTKFEALSLIGQQIEADIKQKMIKLRTPPNAPSTIRRKGSSNPLIDTGHLMQSIRYVVKAEDEK